MTLGYGTVATFAAGYMISAYEAPMWWDKPSGKTVQQDEIKPFGFMRMRVVGFVVTALILIGTTVSLATQGLNMGLDFTGGILIEVEQSEPFDVAAVRSAIDAAGFSESSVTTSDGNRVAIIRLAVDSTGEDVETVTRQVRAALGDQVELRKSDAVGPKVSGELFWSGVTASLLAVVCIGIYIWFRFESKFGAAAFITTFHDVYAVVGLFSITQWTFDLTIVAGVLTVAGYSINDTVVVFDRIREMLKKYKKIPLPKIVDISVTSTLSRTLITSLSTLLAAGAMIALGGPVLFGFAASIAFGILIGTYSSIFVAAPMLLHLPGRVPGSRASQADEAPSPAV